ncbi:MAG TPA: response regulator [Caldithrix abyssi]|uniref:Response regulator n=1 Tax=Caldithrix abyssi TaxID=187145 RepID=A0A7V5RNX1_CALAY|nr:response regulator [Caldithrix abyssi]
MVVDDSSIIRKIIQRGVTEKNYQLVGTASNGLEAIDLFKENPADIVTLDITMPEMDGLVVLEHLLQIKPDVQVIVISALSDKATAIEAIKKGAKSFIPKPFTTEQVQQTIQKLAEKVAV